MPSPNVPDKLRRVAADAMTFTPAMPSIPADELQPGTPHMVVQYGYRYSIGWQLEQEGRA